MKKRVTRLFSILVMIAGISFASSLHADYPPPPVPPGEHGSAINQSPTGTPIHGGLAIFLAFAAVYAGRVYFQMRRDESLNQV